MIVGTLALIALLFSGGVNEIFFIDKLEKGVKEYVIDKDRQKDILVDLKTTKKQIEDFNKDRKSQFKKFKELYKDHSTNDEDLQSFFDQLQAERLMFQDKIVDYRLSIFNKITDDEWNSIIEYSETSVDKKIEKEQKKKSTNEVAFEKTRKAIISSVYDLNKQKEIINGIDDMIDTFEGLGVKIESINVKENKILKQKDAKKKSLKRYLMK
jgi:hypothetical protein